MSESLVVAVRAVMAFFTLLIMTRLLGKKQLSQLTFFEYIIGITVGSIASSMTVDLTSQALPHWIGLIVWVLLAYGLEIIALRSRYLAKLLDGEPVVLIHNGKVLERNMAATRFRMADLMEQIRQQNVFNVADVEFAILETGGQVSVLKKADRQPVTPRDLKIQVQYSGIPTELIVDGVVIEQNLKQVNLDQKWLKQELAKLGLTDPKQVMYGALDTSGKLYVDTYHDRLGSATVDISDYPGPN